jgi:hypothetical protein
MQDDETMNDVAVAACDEQSVEDERMEGLSVSYKTFELRYDFRQDAAANEETVLTQLKDFLSEASSSYDVKLETFRLKELVFTERTAFLLANLFRLCSIWKISWDTLTFDTCVQNNEFRLVLAEALNYSLFSEIELACQPVDMLDSIFINHPEADELDEDTAAVLRDAMIKATKGNGRPPVENLVIRGYTLEPRSSLMLLCHGVGGIRKNPSTLTRLEFNAVRFGHTYEETDMAIDFLAHALSHNQSLVCLVIKDVYPISDTQLARLVLPLVHHPRLSSLTLEAVPWHDETLKALGILLASSKRSIEVLNLSERTLYDEGDHRLQPSLGKPNLHNLMQGVPLIDSSVTTLYLSDCRLDNDDFRLLMYNLWKIPHLAHLDLSYNLISSFDLTSSFQATLRSKPCRLRTLDMTGNPVFCEIDDSQRQHLTNIFFTTLGLGSLGRLLDTNASHHIEKYVEIIRKSDQLENSGLLSADDVIYQLLHGPVFAGRGSVQT